MWTSVVVETRANRRGRTSRPGEQKTRRWGAAVNSCLDQLQVLEVERAVEAAALATEPLVALAQRLRGHIDDRHAEVLGRRDLGRGRQRVALAGEVVLELVQRPREQRVD